MRYAHLAPSALEDTVALLDHCKKVSDFFGQQVGNGEKLPNDNQEIKKFLIVK